MTMQKSLMSSKCMSMPDTHSQQPRSQIFLSHLLTLYVHLNVYLKTLGRRTTTNVRGKELQRKMLRKEEDHIMNPGDIPKKRLFSS